MTWTFQDSRAALETNLKKLQESFVKTYVGCWLCIPSWNHFTSETRFVFPYFSTITMPRSDNAATIRCVFNRDRPASFVDVLLQVGPSMPVQNATMLRYLRFESFQDNGYIVFFSITGCNVVVFHFRQY